MRGDGACSQKIQYLLWQDKEDLYNKATTVIPLCRRNKGKEFKKKLWFVIYRLIACLIIHAILWTGLAILQHEYLKFMSAWCLILNMLTFSLIVIAHFLEAKRKSNKDLNSSCTGETDRDSSSNEDSLFMRNQGLFHPYSPTLGDAQLELLHLQSKNSTLWKFIIILYQVSTSSLLATCLTFWVFIHKCKDIDYANYGAVEISLSALIVIIDFSLSCIIFNPVHSIFVFLFLICFYTFDYLKTQQTHKATY